MPEEELHVGTAQKERGRARLVKYVETGEQQVSEEVRKERIETEGDVES